MAIYKLYECTCDKCGEVEHFVGGNINIAKKNLKSQGWAVGSQMRCPKCLTYSPRLKAGDS